jgi:hypothetical protein
MSPVSRQTTCRTSERVDLDAGGNDILVIRPNADVEVRSLSPGDVEFVQALGDGLSVIEATKIRPRRMRRLCVEEIAGNEFNLNSSRYNKAVIGEEEIDLGEVNAELVSLEQKIEVATRQRNQFIKELGLSLLP